MILNITSFYTLIIYCMIHSVLYMMHYCIYYTLDILSVNYRVKALRAYHSGDLNQLTILAFFTKCAWMLMRWIKLMHY